jgi:hypothetical protein
MRTVTEKRTARRATRVDHRPAEEAGVGAHRQRSARAGGARPVDRLGHEAARAAAVVGGALAQPNAQHLVGSCPTPPAD